MTEDSLDREHRPSILYMLGQLTAKVDTLLTNQISNNERHGALEARVTVLERDKAKVLGVFIVVSLLVGLGVEYFLR